MNKITFAFLLIIGFPIIFYCQEIKSSDAYLESILLSSNNKIYSFSTKGLLHVAGGYDGKIFNYKVFNEKVYIWHFNYQLQELSVNSVGGGTHSERIEDPRPFSENNYIAIYGFKRLVDEKYVLIKEKASFPECFWSGVLPDTVSLKNDTEELNVAGYKIDKNDIPNQFNPNTIFYQNPDKKTPIKFILRLEDNIEITSPSSTITYISSVTCLTENQLDLYSKSLANIGVNSSFYFDCRGVGSTIINNAKWYCVELVVNEQENIYAWTQNTNSNEPLNVVLSYYENINKKNYSAAYNIWHKTVSYNSFLDLYKDTQLILPLDAREASPGNWNLAIGIADSSVTWQGLYVGFEIKDGVILRSSPGLLIKANALNIKTWRSDLNNSEIENILQGTQWINPQALGNNNWDSMLSFYSDKKTNVDFLSYYIDSGLIYIYDNRDKNLLRGATYRLVKNSSATSMWRLDKVASSAEWFGADSFLSLQLPPSDGTTRLFGDYLIKCGDKPKYFNDRAAFRESPSSISFANISNLENALDSKLWSCSPCLHYAEILSSKLAENKLIENSTRSTIEWIGSTIVNQKKWYLVRLANTIGSYYYLWTDNLADDYPRIIYDYYIALNNKAFDLADSYRVQKKGNQFYLNNYTDCYGIFPISFRRGMYENTWIFNVAYQTSSLEKAPDGLSWLKYFKFYEVVFTVNDQGIIDSASTELKDNVVY